MSIHSAVIPGLDSSGVEPWMKISPKIHVIDIEIELASNHWLSIIQVSGAECMLSTEDLLFS
jgi:hypothetical protein